MESKQVVNILIWFAMFHIYFAVKAQVESDSEIDYEQSLFYCLVCQALGEHKNRCKENGCGKSGREKSLYLMLVFIFTSRSMN